MVQPVLLRAFFFVTASKLRSVRPPNVIKSFLHPSSFQLPRYIAVLVCPRHWSFFAAWLGMAPAKLHLSAPHNQGVPLRPLDAQVTCLATTTLSPLTCLHVCTSKICLLLFVKAVREINVVLSRESSEDGVGSHVWKLKLCHVRNPRRSSKLD